MFGYLFIKRDELDKVEKKIEDEVSMFVQRMADSHFQNETKDDTELASLDYSKKEQSFDQGLSMIKQKDS